MTHYDVSCIIEMSQLDHLRQHSGMYVGDTETATHLLEELLDNSIDEVQQGSANIIGVFIDTKDNTFRVLDNGRGFPFDQSLPLEKDPPILSATKLFTSGKFQKGKAGSSYDISIGLHGIGLVACFALSEYMTIDIYRKGIHGEYNFKHDGTIDRSQGKYDKAPFSTRVIVKPSKKYFQSTSIDIKQIEERLLIAAANYPNLKIVFRIDEENRIISGTENDLILSNIGKNINEWFSIESKKGVETSVVRMGWDDEPPTAMKIFTTVNLCKVNEGAHINKVVSIVKKYFQSFIGKNNPENNSKYSFQPADAMVGFRLYINLKIIKASYAEQIKKKLSTQSDLSVMDDFEQKLEAYFKNNQNKLYELLNTFQAYRNSITNKKLTGVNNTGQKRGMTVFTKLRDCTQPNGELFICEGDSAGGGLIDMRDTKKHAILPLKGVIPNAITKTDFHNNKELKDIIIACGCGIDEHCDIEKLRYSKIILAADADPAGHWITALLITLFAYKMRPVVKAGKLYVCETPLFGYKEKGVLHPIWNDAELEKAKKDNKKILRFKGLGEFNPEELEVFTFNEQHRKLVQVNWSNNNFEKLFDLMSNSEERRKLVLGEWRL